MAELQAKWGDLTAGERRVLLESKNETAWSSSLDQREAAAKAMNTNIHFLEKHGPSTTLLDQEIRASTKLGPDGSIDPAFRDSTGFLSNRDMGAAMQFNSRACKFRFSELIPAGRITDGRMSSTVLRQLRSAPRPLGRARPHIAGIKEVPTRLASIVSTARRVRSGRTEHPQPSWGGTAAEEAVEHGHGAHQPDRAYGDQGVVPYQHGLMVGGSFRVFATSSKGQNSAARI